MKKTLSTIILLAVLVPTVMAGFTPTYMPDSSYHDGYSFFNEDMGDAGILKGRVEYAVYDTTVQAGDLGLGQDYDGARFIYAYQVFTHSNSDAALDYFAIQGIDPSTIANVDDDISAAETMGSADSYGVEPDNFFFNDAVTEGIWFFNGMTIAQSENSWFLLIYSNYDYTDGDYTVTAPDGSDISVPDGGLDSDTGDVSTPEPTTLAMLLGGALLSLKRKK